MRAATTSSRAANQVKTEACSADHLTGQRTAAPKCGLGAGALAWLRPHAEGGHVDHQRGKAHLGEGRADRPLQAWPAFQQLGGADLVAESVRVDAQHRRHRPVVRRASEEAAHRLACPRLEFERLEHEAVAAPGSSCAKGERMLADLERVAQPVHHIVRDLSERRSRK